MVSMLPDMMVVATGMAMAFQMRGEQRCALSFFGDGATSRGDWHEAMNWAARRPAAGDLRAREQPARLLDAARRSSSRVNPVERAAGYGIPALTVDGNDVEAVFEAVREARERALAGDGPTLIEAVTMRMHGHGAHDDARYVPPEMLAAWQAAATRSCARRARLPRPASTSTRSPTRSRPRSPRRSPRRWRRRCPTRRRPRRALLRERAAAVGRGDAPWSGYGGEPERRRCAS